MTVCSSYQWTCMSGSVLCFAETEPWIQSTPNGRAGPWGVGGLKSIGSEFGVMRPSPVRWWFVDVVSAAGLARGAASGKSAVHGGYNVVDGRHATCEGHIVLVDDEPRSD